MYIAPPSPDAASINDERMLENARRASAWREEVESAATARLLADEQAIDIGAEARPERRAEWEAWKALAEARGTKIGVLLRELISEAMVDNEVWIAEYLDYCSRLIAEALGEDMGTRAPAIRRVLREGSRDPEDIVCLRLEFHARCAAVRPSGAFPLNIRNGFYAQVAGSMLSRDHGGWAKDGVPGLLALVGITVTDEYGKGEYGKGEYVEHAPVAPRLASDEAKDDEDEIFPL